MFWKNCHYTHFPNNFGEFVKISGIEVEYNSQYWVYITKGEYEKLIEGQSLENVLENYSKEILDFLRTGNAPMFKNPINGIMTPIHKAYVTNAVANSVVFYAMMYLNYMGLTPNQIRDLRIKYSLGNLNQKKFTLDELREKFINQSAFFMNLYSYMNENDRFENFADNLQQQNTFKEVFKYYKDSEALKRQYSRKIFHTKFECYAMRNDYEEENFHQNTGIFTEKKQDAKKQEYYMVEMPYLETLNMRVCKKCVDNNS